MNVLFVIAEMAPLVKVGGVGDVGGSLPRALRRLGLDVRAAIPFYETIDRTKLVAQRVVSLPDGALWRADVGGVPVYLVEHAPSFARERVYGYKDDAGRFLAFCDRLLAAAPGLDWRPHVLHQHDWHAGFLAARLAGAPEHPWAAAARVCTVHNLGYPGQFDAAFAKRNRLPVDRSGLPAKLARSGLAQGLLHADVVSTVSPTYARELLTPELGGELAPLLRRLADHLAGIMNGIDVDAFDPATDQHLAARFDAERLDARVENKRELQRRLGLLQEDDTPVVGMVTRLFHQKGTDLAARAVERLLAGRDFQLAVLGQGEERYEQQMRALAARHPRRVAARIAFDAALGQLIYGGSDLFLMPSRYEPCGLGQLIAMRYGAVPVVRRTGGLADSVQPYDAAGGTGTGFLFDAATAAAIDDALGRALDATHDRGAWRRTSRGRTARASTSRCTMTRGAARPPRPGARRERATRPRRRPRRHQDPHGRRDRDR